ncbi:hypothetical protein BH23CHL4_BH23CHL4_26570 [soil metagenome]
MLSQDDPAARRGKSNRHCLAIVQTSRQEIETFQPKGQGLHRDAEQVTELQQSDCGHRTGGLSPNISKASCDFGLYDT